MRPDSSSREAITVASGPTCTIHHSLPTSALGHQSYTGHTGAEIATMDCTRPGISNKVTSPHHPPAYLPLPWPDQVNGLVVTCPKQHAGSVANQPDPDFPPPPVGSGERKLRKSWRPGGSPSVRRSAGSRFVGRIRHHYTLRQVRDFEAPAAILARRPNRKPSARGVPLARRAATCIQEGPSLRV